MFYLSADRGRPRDDHRRVAALLPRPRPRARDAAPACRSARRSSSPSASTPRCASLDLARRGVLGEVFSGSREAAFFQLEIAIGVILPMALLACRPCAATPGGSTGPPSWWSPGFVVNRLNVSITGLEGGPGRPLRARRSARAIITLMLVGIGIAAFGLAVRFLPVMPKVEEPELARPPSRRPPAALCRRPREELEDAAQDRHLRGEAPPALEAPRRSHGPRARARGRGHPLGSPTS